MRGSETLNHGGGIFGFSTDNMYVPSADLSVTILTNSDSAEVAPGTVMNRIAALAMGRPFPQFATVPLDATAVKPMLGVYQFGGAKRTLSMRDGKLVIQRDENPQMDLFAGGNNRFHYGKQDLSWFELRKDPSGKHIMAFHPNGDDEEAIGTWAGPVPEVVEVAIAPERLAAYAGSYSTPMGKATIAPGEPGKLTVQIEGQPKLAMRAISESEFLVERVNARLSFVSADGKVSGIEIAQGGRKLAGTRD